MGHIPSKMEILDDRQEAFTGPGSLWEKVRSLGLRLLKSYQKSRQVWPEQFCLITGSPRSGTTAVERWLGQQREVVAFHETRILIAIHRFIKETARYHRLEPEGEFTRMAREIAYEYYSNRSILIGRQVILDKEPLEPIAFPDADYALFLQNLRLLFPEGKLLFMVRDPIATVWSMCQRKWGYSLVDYEPRTLTLDEHIENWCTCADIVLDYIDDPNAYVCAFGQLVDTPQEESERILRFLNLSGGEAFRPQAVKKVGFGDADRSYILQRTNSRVDALKQRGILNR
jgi:hypothetical protein